MNNICEIEANPANAYSGTEPYVNGRTDEQTDGWMDGRHAPYHDTSDFRRAYKTRCNGL